MGLGSGVCFWDGAVPPCGHREWALLKDSLAEGVGDCSGSQSRGTSSRPDSSPFYFSSSHSEFRFASRSYLDPDAGAGEVSGTLNTRAVPR